MNHRILTVVLTLGVFLWLTPWPAASQTATTQDGDAATSPRTTWGDPELQGALNFTLDTPLNRPAEFGTRAVLTEEEVAQRAQASAQMRSGYHFNYDRFLVDARRTTRQTSLVVDPPTVGCRR